MAKKGSHTPYAVLGDVRDAHSLYHYLQRFNAWSQERNYAQATIRGREVSLRYFITWCLERGFQRPNEVTKPIIERYQSHCTCTASKTGSL